MLNLYTVGLKNTADLRLYIILHSLYHTIQYNILYHIFNYITLAAVRNFKIVLEYKIQFDHPPVVWFCLQLVLT